MRLGTHSRRKPPASGRRGRGETGIEEDPNNVGGGEEAVSARMKRYWAVLMKNGMSARVSGDGPAIARAAAATERPDQRPSYGRTDL
jgi:hypothetical protein